MRLREVSRSELVEQYIMENIVAARNPGDRIPSEAALSKEIGVAVPTVNKILASLTDRGILFRKKGLGTYVAEQSPKGKVVRSAPRCSCGCNAAPGESGSRCRCLRHNIQNIR